MVNSPGIFRSHTRSISSQHKAVWLRNGSFNAWQISSLRKSRNSSRVVLTTGADVIDEEVVLGDLVPLFGVVPVPSGVGDQQSLPIDQGVVDGDHTLVAGAGGGVLLEPFQSSRVEGLDIPHGLGEEAVEAGLIGGPGELVMDAKDRLALGDEESGEVLGEVAALALHGCQGPS